MLRNVPRRRARVPEHQRPLGDRQGFAGTSGPHEHETAEALRSCGTRGARGSSRPSSRTARRSRSICTRSSGRVCSRRSGSETGSICRNATFAATRSISRDSTMVSSRATGSCAADGRICFKNTSLALVELFNVRDIPSPWRIPECAYGGAKRRRPRRDDDRPMSTLLRLAAERHAREATQPRVTRS